MTQSTKQSGGVQSVDRAFQLLELMADRGNQSLTELSNAMGLAVPTTHRFLQTLVSLGYARQLENRRYGLGLGLIRLARTVDVQFAPVARPHLEALVEKIGESANLAVFEGDMIVYVAHVPSPHAMRMFTEDGHRAYTHSTGVGKAILSQLSDDQVDRVIDRVGLPAATPTTITDPGDLRKELARIRKVGYAVDSGEHEEGVRCYAVPVLDLPISMALSVSGPNFRMTKELGKKAVPLLQARAKALSKDLLGTIA